MTALGTRASATALVGLLLLASPAQAQRGGCDLGVGLAALATANHLLTAPTTSLAEGRDQASQTSTALHEARAILFGCGCRRLAEQAAEGAGLAEQARSEASVAGLRRALDRAGLSLSLARERAGTAGCS